MHEDFLRLKAAFNASTSVVRVPKRDSPMKVAVLVSRKVYFFEYNLVVKLHRVLSILLSCFLVFQKVSVFCEYLLLKLCNVPSVILIMFSL